jgi:hypothetical protein
MQLPTAMNEAVFFSGNGDKGSNNDDADPPSLSVQIKFIHGVSIQSISYSH